MCINTVMNDARDWCGCGLQVVRYIVTIIICQVKDARSKSALADAAIYGRPNEFIGRADVLNQCTAIYKSLLRETAGQKRAKQTIKHAFARIPPRVYITILYAYSHHAIVYYTDASETVYISVYNTLLE